jgi:YqaJ-like viral recombinase domain
MTAVFRYDLKQNSAEWFRARLAIPTASEFHRIITPTGKKSSQAGAYMFKLLYEYVTNLPCQSEEDSYQSRWMEDGHQYEETVAKSFELMTGHQIEKIGGISNCEGLVWASPDRIIKNVACVELKAPAPWTQLGYLIQKDSLIEDYRPQLQGQLFVSELDRQFITSDNHRIKCPPVLMEVTRDEAYLAKLQEYLTEFLDKMLNFRIKLRFEFGLIPPQPKPIEANPFGVSMEDLEAILNS